MAAARTKLPKTETLTIRLDPRTRFQLEFVSRLRGQTITTVVERAILEAADHAKVEKEMGPDLTWQSVWHVNEGARALRMARHPELYPTFPDEQRLHFAKEHWPFFYADEDRTAFMLPYLEVLWPNIDEFVSMFEERKKSDYFAAGNAMADTLTVAKLEPPKWPPEKKVKKPPSKYGDIDDDIPF